MIAARPRTTDELLVSAASASELDKIRDAFPAALSGRGQNPIPPVGYSKPDDPV